MLFREERDVWLRDVFGADLENPIVEEEGHYNWETAYYPTKLTSSFGLVVRKKTAPKRPNSKFTILFDDVGDLVRQTGDMVRQDLLARVKHVLSGEIEVTCYYEEMSLETVLGDKEFAEFIFSNYKDPVDGVRGNFWDQLSARVPRVRL